MKQFVATVSVLGLAVLGLGNAWAAEWRTLRSIERWHLQESEGARGRKFRITTTALDAADFSLIYRCDRTGADNITLVHRQKREEAGPQEDYALRYETGTNVRSLVAVGSNGRSFSFQRGTPPYRQLFQDLMRSTLVTFEVQGEAFVPGRRLHGSGRQAAGTVSIPPHLTMAVPLPASPSLASITADDTAVHPEVTLSNFKSPPFRAEHIGSLLRPPALLAMRGRFARGEIERDTLRNAEDAAIRDALALQERVGLRFATDGEFRRRSYHSYFYRQLGDLSVDTVAGEDAKGGDRGRRAEQPVALVNGRVQWTRPINVEDFRFIQAHTGLVPKITIPGPCALHFRGGDAAVLKSAYRDLDQFWDDTVAAFGQELKALADAGCRYVQVDETAFAKFGDPEVQASLKARGDDWSALIDTYIAVTNRVLRAAPAGLAIGMHLCRGNRGGQWHAEGTYDEVAERLFNTLDIRFYFLEYDTPRAGTFAPLRYVPKHKHIVLGLISTKTPAVERREDLRARVAEATRFVDLDRLSVSPQCGFASVETGNPISPRVQEQKLGLVVDLAREVWGEA